MFEAKEQIVSHRGKFPGFTSTNKSRLRNTKYSAFLLVPTQLAWRLGDSGN